MSAGVEPLRLGVSDGDTEFVFETRAGVRSPDSFHPAELAVLEALVEADPARVLVLGATYGAIGIPATTFADDVAMATWRARTRTLCERNSHRNDVDTTTHLIASPSELSRTFDAIAYAPRDYTPNAVVAQHVVDALPRLEAGCPVFLGARDEAGGAAHARLLDEHLSIEELETTGPVPVRRLEKPPAFDPPTFVETQQFDVTVDDTPLTLVSRPGLFSADTLDTGTRLLIETLDLTSDDRVLDLACGYGPIGAYAAAHGCQTTLTDDSRPATKCAEATLTANDLDATVHTADTMEAFANESFDLIASNPPTHTSDEVLDELLGDLSASLTPGGRVRLVHHESLDLDPNLDNRLSNPKILAHGNEHVILGATNPA